MAAHPKNKVTRVEQGKRRAGNTPKLVRDTNMFSVAPHKKGLFTRFLSVFSAKPAAAKKTTKTGKDDIKTETEGVATPIVTKTDGTSAKVAPARPQRASSVVKKTTRTQHKGA